MDNFTHSLTGWALGQAGLKQRTRMGLAALVLGANMPDIDVFFGWVPWLPLATHRGVTHSLVAGTLLMPPMLAALLWLLDRWLAPKRPPESNVLPMDARWLVALSYIGTITHPLLDLQTNYAVQLLSPFSNRWFHTETLFIIDVWIWTGLSVAIWLSRRREARGLNWRRPPAMMLIALCLYIATNGGISLAARRALAAQLPRKPDLIIAGIEPVAFWRRTLVWRSGASVGEAAYDPFFGAGRVRVRTPPMPDNMGQPVVRRAMSADARIQRFMRWSIMPVAFVRQMECRSGVTIVDARFGLDPRRSALSASTVVETGGRGCRKGPGR